MPITFLDEEEDIALPVTPTKRKITFLDEEDDQTQLQSMRDRFAPRPLITEKEEQEIGTLEGISNAAKNAFDSSRQAMDVVGGVTPEEAQNIAKIEFDKKSRKLAPGYDEYQKAEGMDAVWAFAKNPIEVTSNIIAEGLAGSLPALGAGLVTGGVAAVAAAPTVIGAPVAYTGGQIAGTFAGSLATEYGGKVLEELQKEGMDITDPNSIQTFFGNEELMGGIRNKALLRGVPVAAFDAVSAGIGGKLGRVFGTKAITEGEKIIGKQFATKTGEAATELGAQALLGGGGEVAGALAAGEPIEGKAVFGEVIGEVGPGSIEVLTGRIADQRAMAKTREEAKIKATSELSTKLEENNAPLTANVVTAKSATNIEQDKLAAQLEEELTIQETAAAAAQQQKQTDATKEIIQPEGVRQEPQDGTQVETEEAGVSDSILNATRSEEERQVARDIVNELQAVSNNTATNEQIARLSMDGLVDVRRGQAIINEDGEGILAQAQAQLPKLTPEAMAAEVEAAQVPKTRDELVSELEKREAGKDRLQELTSAGERLGEEGQILDDILGIAPNSKESENLSNQEKVTRLTPEQRIEYGNRLNSLVSQRLTIATAPVEATPVTPTPSEPIIGEEPQVSPIVGEQVAETTPVEQVTETQIAEEPIISEKPQTSEIVGAETTAIVEQKQVAPAVVTELEGADPIVAAAVRQKDGRIFSGSLHVNAIDEAQLQGYNEKYDDKDYGFITRSGKFLDSKSAREYAISQKQVKRETLERIEKEAGISDVDEDALESGVFALAQSEEKTETPAPEVAPASFGQRMLDSINEKLAQGKDVFISTMTKSTKVNKKAVDNWSKAGKPLFKVGKDGNLYIGSGKRYNQLTSADMALVGFSSEGKKLAVAEPVTPTPVTNPVVEPSRTGITEPAIATEEQVVTEREAAPAEGIVVGNRIKLGKSPQTYTIEEVIPQTATERDLGEQYYSVKNERTREVQVVEAMDLKKVGGKRAKKLFAGEKADMPQFMRDSLDTARAMDVAGKTSEEIRVLTGWFPGIDGKMRWEIPDQNVKLKDDWINANTVGDLIEHKELFDAYPDISNVNFKFASGRSAGITKDGTLVLPIAFKYLSVTEMKLQTILHEIQHLIQSREGFERGGNPESIYEKEKTQIEQKQKKLEDIRDRAGELAKKNPTKENREAWKKSVDDVWDVMGEKPKQRSNEEEMDYYMRISGEIESRDVEERMRLTPEQRKLVKPYSSQNISPDQIVLMNELISEPKLEETQLQPAIEQQEAVTPIPELNRYTYEEAVRLVDSYFDKEGIPEGVVIVNNTTDPDLEMKAGYFVDRGQIVINLAYIAKGENLSDIISHELGHFIFSDPQFQSDFKAFWDLMTPEEQADADRIINQFYNKETGAIQMEEKQVRAFMQLIQDSKAMPKWKQLLDSIKRWINEKLGTNFQVTDRGALSVLAAAHKRFKFGEQIVREIDSGVLKMAAEPKRERVGGKERGEAITTPEGIIEQSKAVIRNKFFDGTEVSDEKTLQAWNYIEQFLDIESGASNELAGLVNDVVDQETNSDTRMGASLLHTELGNYAAKLADKGDMTMLPYIIRRINRMRLDNLAGDISEYARGMRARQELDINGFNTLKTENESKVERTAAALFGTSKPSKEQVKVVKDAIDAADEESVGTPENVATEIEKVEKRTGRKVIKAIDDKIKESTKPKKEELLISFENLDADRKIKGITIKYNPQKVNVAKNIKDFIIGKMVDYRKTLVNQGAGGLESTFWQTMSANENKSGSLGELDQAQNNELAKIVKNTLIKLGLKGEPPNTKMTDIEKVASILNENKLSDEKRLEADSRIVEEIERRRQGELASGSSPEAVNAKYDVILDAWNEAMSRQINMPISDNMLQRLLKSEIKERNTKTSELINEEDGRVVEEVKNDIVDSIIRRIYGVSKESEIGIEMDEDYSNLQSYLKQTLNNMYATAIDKKNAAYAKRQAQISLRSNVEGQAQSIINQLADQMTDTPAFPQKQENQVKTIVQQDLRQKPNMGRKQPWTSQITAKLIQAGVSETQAQTISDLVWRQHEIKAMDRELKELQTAAEKGSLAVIIQRIKDTPLAMQQEPNWMQSVIRDYLVEAGLSEKAAVAAARLYESVIAERFAEAKQKAFEAALAKSAPWKNYLSRNSQLGKNALKKIQEAIRTGVLDPTQTTEGIIAKENGWSGFSKEQLTRIVQLDDILSDDTKDQVTKAEAMHELNRIIVKAKMPVRFRDAISAYYVGQALLGIPTFAVNISSPVITALRNASIDIAKYAVTDPKNVPVVFKSFINSIQNFYDNASFAFKSQIYMSGEVEYMQGQNVLRELFDKGVNQWNKGERAKGMANMLVGMTQITGRILSALDQGAIAMMQSQSIPRYVLAAMEGNRNIPKDKYKAIADLVLDGRRKSREYLIASGMSPDRAGVLADLQVRSEIISSLSDVGISFKDVLDASLNDALQSVGRNRAITINSLKQETKDLRDAGIISGIPIGFLENLASNASKGGQAQQVFAKMLYGFALVPARVFSTAAWFSPIGFVRLGVDSLLQKAGFESRYAMSLGNELQYKQRMFESIAGSAVMLGLYALLTPSTDDDEDKWFKIVITGNGPDYNTDPQYYDSWHKNNESSSIQLHFGKTVSKININRGGEALAIPMMFIGALDDWKIKEKQNQAKKSPEDLEMAASVIGSAFYALAQRGPWASFGKSLFDAKSGDKFVPKLFGQAAFLGKTFIPVLGTSVARNISDFINDPVDKSSIQGAIYANTPVIGPMIGTKSLNALGQPIRADDWGDKMFKLGSPLVFSFPKNTPENELNQLILKKGDGPTIPTRTNAQKKLDGPITDKEFEIYVREYGRVVSDKMFKNRKKLETMESKNYIKELDKYVNGYSIDGIKVTGASDMAVRAVKLSRNK